jgi:autotransporter-associated beta strand protein
LTGNINLPAGFTNSLPTILYGPTTLLEAGTGTFSGPISGSFGLSGSGQVILTGAHTYTGATAVNSGTLEVDGLIANTSSVTVNSGGTLSGTGIVDPTTTTIMSGGTLAPGNAAMPTGTLTITGNLAFQSGAIYLVQVTPSAAASTNVSGTATLTGATVNVQFASGDYLAKRYTILTATGGLGGTTFAGITNSNLPAGASDNLSYDANNVYLNLTPGFTSYTGLNVNQHNIATALTTFFNANGGVPAAFFGLSPAALTQVDGEAATGAERSAFQIMTQFLSLMLDPFVDGRLGGFGTAGGSAIGFAPEQRDNLPPDVALAYASILAKAPPPPTSDQRWTAWASYGGGNRTNGDQATGSNNVTASSFGFAAGMDYHFAPIPLLASHSPAAAPIGDWRMRSAPGAAMRCKPASAASAILDRPMSPARSPSPIIGSRSTARRLAISSMPISTVRAMAFGLRAVIASACCRRSARHRTARFNSRISTRRPTASPMSAAPASGSPTRR